MFSGPAGYLIAPNATEYEFDFNVYSPVGTVVFEALLVAEIDISNFVLIIARFDGALTEYTPYSINGMDTEVQFTPLITTAPLLTIRLDEALDPNDGQVDYTFRLNYFGAALAATSDGVDVIIHEISKLLYSYMFNMYKYY